MNFTAHTAQIVFFKAIFKWCTDSQSNTNSDIVKNKALCAELTTFAPLMIFTCLVEKQTKSVCQSKRLTHSFLCFVYEYKYIFFIHKQIYILCANSLLPFKSFMNYRQVIRTHWQTHTKKTSHSLHWKAGDSANAVPLTKKLRTRVIYIWDDRLGQPVRSAMDRPRQRRTSLMIKVSSVPGKYAWYQRKLRPIKRHFPKFYGTLGNAFFCT